MKNIVLVLAAFLLLFPYKLMAENKVISIEDGWDIENDRSISFVPQLSIDEQNIYIYSEKELNDLEVIITDSLGNVIYYNVTAVSEYTTYPINITDFRTGNYTIQMIEKYNYIKGIISCTTYTLPFLEIRKYSMSLIWRTYLKIIIHKIKLLLYGILISEELIGSFF